MKELKVASCFEFEKVLRGRSNKLFYSKSDVDNAIAELKQKLEDAKATAYAESVDAGMRERRLKRALYKAIANWAKVTKIWDGSRPPDDFDKWFKVERKCRAKAEQYK